MQKYCSLSCSLFSLQSQMKESTLKNQKGDDATILNMYLMLWNTNKGSYKLHKVVTTLTNIEQCVLT